MATFYTVTPPHKKSTTRTVVVVLAPGAGGDRKSPGLVAIARKLSEQGIMTLLFDFPYRIAGKKAPDSEKVLREQWAKAIDVAVKKCAEINKSSVSIKVVIGGRSMGGRIASLIAQDRGKTSFDVDISKTRSVTAKIHACLFLSYPLHAPGKQDRKDKHFPDIVQKSLFVSGNRDVFAMPTELKSSAKKIKGSSKVVILDGGDHELKTLKSSDVTFDDLNGQLAEEVARFVLLF